jgi:hypothetical protein
MDCITIKLQPGKSIQGLTARNKRLLFQAILREIGAAGGSRSTPAKKKAALAREAKKRKERAG